MAESIGIEFWNAPRVGDRWVRRGGIRDNGPRGRERALLGYASRGIVVEGRGGYAEIRYGLLRNEEHRAGLGERSHDLTPLPTITFSTILPSSSTPLAISSNAS